MFFFSLSLASSGNSNCSADVSQKSVTAVHMAVFRSCSKPKPHVSKEKKSVIAYMDLSFERVIPWSLD
jgi:hypothetical protein